ncbi:MAG TPA: hypothetical protein VFP97_01620 [Chitinophagaceae bacterium]|nr:hypothetical protein [Chitinophagaceae bacterium]
MDNQEKIKPDTTEKDIDLGAFLTVLSRFFRSIGLAIKFFFTSIFYALLYLLLFIKRKLIWILGGGLIALAVGLYSYMNGPQSYYSELVVKPNFESTRLLYQKINSFNSLIAQHKLAHLSKLFNIDQTTASKLRSFKISPIKDPLHVASLYRSIYLDYDRAGFAADTAFAKTIKFSEFKKLLTDYDYPLHSIRAESADPAVFANLQQGIIKSMNENTVLLHAKETNEKLTNEEERIISSSIESMDTLRKAYAKRILSAGSSETPNNTNIYLSQPNSRYPEIDVYDKTLLLRDELVTLRKRNAAQKDILQVYSDFNDTGTKVPRFKRFVIYYTLIGCVAVFSILLIMEFYRFLGEYEKKQKVRINF